MRANGSIDTSSYARASRGVYSFSHSPGGNSSGSQISGDSTELLFETFLATPPAAVQRPDESPDDFSPRDDDDEGPALVDRDRPDKHDRKPEVSEKDTSEPANATAEAEGEYSTLYPELIATTLAPTTSYATDAPVPIQETELQRVQLPSEQQPTTTALGTETTSDAPATVRTEVNTLQAKTAEDLSGAEVPLEDSQLPNSTTRPAHEHANEPEAVALTPAAENDTPDEANQDSRGQQAPIDELPRASESRESQNEASSDVTRAAGEKAQEDASARDESQRATQAAQEEEPAKWYEQPTEPNTIATTPIGGDDSSDLPSTTEPPTSENSLDVDAPQSNERESSQAAPTSDDRTPDTANSPTRNENSAAAAALRAVAAGETPKSETLGSPTSPSRSGAEAPTRPVASATKPASTATADSANQPEITQQERVRLIQRVARSFSRLGAEGGQLHLRLHPPQLGSLAVRVQVEGGSMSAKLTAESESAREVILEGLPMLKKRLADQGVEISQFQVDVSSGTDDTFTGGNPDQRQSEFREGNRPRSIPAMVRNNQAQQDEPPPVNEPRHVVTSYSLDVQA